MPGIASHVRMAEPTESTSRTVVEGEEAATTTQETATLRLRLKKPKTEKKVAWTASTIDNENMDKKKSKCCCIFEKPREFGESSSESDEDECEHCRGHVEMKKKNNPSSETETNEGTPPVPENPDQKPNPENSDTPKPGQSST